ncbi:MAG: SDR family NAD(P)-dependent oxidoreductase [Chloroflexi bacterium]|nr:SDR family NAD(P)-dependent oxidoreductase [Chloroflexota bacterium]
MTEPEARLLPADEPVAIVGMACRFPGADDIDSFWRLLEDGRSAVSEGVPGSGVGRIGELFSDPDVKSEACRFGAYLDAIGHFDASFFRISPIEAQMLDPQQRLMLETSWQALEDAGIDPDRLRGTRTGVYAGISNNEYRNLVLEASETAEPAASLYSVSGTSFNTAIGRVAFALGLNGPAMAVDTACSSSLVAVHQAVVGLQRRESDLALAGGVHAILSGRLLELRANAGMLAPDGRCKTFDAAANGYVRGEGCGILVLKRLADAEADGDRIWAIVRGAALNQDGASPGLTVPSGGAQQQVIVDALARAGLEPADVDYVEAHGTGTPVGDPIEAAATGAAYGRDRSRPLLIGSVKTNLGHLEAAAGVAGLIKVALAMKHGVIPRHLNFTTPNPEIPWEQLPLRVTAEPTPWPLSESHPPLAGVSGFGWSGTNAHVVLQGYGAPQASPDGGGWAAGAARSVALPPGGSAPDAAPPAPRATRLLPLSAKSGDALSQLAGRYLAWLDERAEVVAAAQGADDPLLADMAWTAGVGRSQFAHRAGAAFRDVSSLREALTEITGAAAGPGPGAATRVAFAYTGQASQWVGMGRALYEREPVARSVLDRCDEVLREERGRSLLDVMFGRDPAAGELDDPAWTQPAIYALECALTALWGSVGVRPSVVVGHSLGEIAAAEAAGVYSLEDGLRFAARRGELLGALPANGAMAAVFAPAARIAAAVEEHNAASTGPDVAIAADNGAQQVISGPAEDVAALVERFQSEGLWARALRRSPAYHSALVEPALDDLEAALGELAISSPAVELISSMTGRVVEAGARLDGAYWRRQARQPVAFRDCIATLADGGVDVVVEIGPQAVLAPMVAMGWPGGAEPATIASLRGPGEAEETGDSGFVEAVAQAFEAGLALSFEGLFAGERRRRVSLPGYPFQRHRYWVESPRRRRLASGHPLLGVRHESPRGEVLFERELAGDDPAWLGDHRVFGEVVAPGALFAALAAAASPGADGALAVDELQLCTALVLTEEEHATESVRAARRVQVVLDGAGQGAARRVEVYSRAEGDETWTLHAEAHVSSASGGSPGERVDVGQLTAGLSAEEPGIFYRARADASIDLGPSFRTLQRLWCGEGEAVAEVALPEGVESAGPGPHPVLLDGLLQVMGAARSLGGVEEGATFLPFAWERLWLAEPLPERVICHARIRGAAPGGEGEAAAPRDAVSGDLRIYTPEGIAIGGIDGYAAKRATRSTLLAGTERAGDLLYEVVWEDRPIAPGIPPPDFLPSPSAVAAGWGPFSEYLAAEGVAHAERAALLEDLERMAWSVALTTLDRLGWKRTAGETVEPDVLRGRLGVPDAHGRLFRRMFELLAAAAVVDARGDGFIVRVGTADPLPEAVPPDPEAFAAELAARHDHGSTEIELFRRCGGALAEVLRGEADPLTLLFSSGEPSAGDLYRLAPVARAANRLLGDAVAALLRELPEDRRLRVIEVGAGTGSATGMVLPELPPDRYDYVYTDISAGFFAEAEARFGGSEASIDYRVLDIETDPVEQGFDAHGYDLVIASNVLHATRFLHETLAHCRDLLAPSGHLVALENLRGQGWLDLTFGQLDGWWRFADDYRPHHALAGPEVWKRVLADAGFAGAEVLGGSGGADGRPDRGVIVAQGPEEVAEPAGAWVLVADDSGVAEALAAELVSRRQRVVLAPRDASDRGSWRALIEALPADVPLRGVVHLTALDGHGAEAAPEELAADVRRSTGSALALVQGLSDAGTVPSAGVWFLTRGGQVLERERLGQLTGALLWGLGKVVEREASQLRPRMIDLDPGAEVPLGELADELLRPDAESHVAHRLGRRRAARLVRAADVSARLPLPEGSGWALRPDAGGSLERMRIEPLEGRRPGPREVRVAVEAAGLNFRDMFVALGVFEDELGGEFCGRVIEVGEDVSTVAVGDRVVGLAPATFRSEAVMREELVAPAPAGIPAAALATMPTAFVSAALSFDYAQLAAGDRVLIHAAAGGVGLAAVQLAQAAGAEVFATASAPKQDYLRALGVEHVFDSRRTAFGGEILEATGGEGVDVVLNSLTGPGFIEASLACLKPGGRFVEMARVDILTEEEMAAARPDVAYSILRIDVLKEEQPQIPGSVLIRVMERLAAGELRSLNRIRWPLAEAEPAIEYMRAARHIGKIVLTNSALEAGRLREDRSYLVTGGLGGIGCAVAGWLADRGAGVIVLNGRRTPDTEAEAAIAALRARGVRVEVELADVTDAEAVGAMLARIDGSLPPLAGVIHSVGVLSDAALTNQSWERFEEVLWPKVLGAWHLHRATLDRDLDVFLLFSSVAGVMGNPGQANHSAANAFLDQLAGHRRALGLPGQSIAWGAWAGLGEAEEQRERIAGQLEAAGTGWIEPEQGLRALELLVRQDATAAVVASIDWSVFSENVDQRSPLLEHLLSAGQSPAGVAEASPADLLAGLRHASLEDREEALAAFLQRELQAVMRLTVAPARSTEFADLGMDSLMAVELRNRINRAFTGEYVASNTVVFDYPSVSGLAAHLAHELAGGDEAPSLPGPREPRRRPEIASGDGIAIVGMACRFPGGEGLDSFWRLLESKGDAVTDGRRDSGSWEGVAGDPEAAEPSHRRGAFLDRIDAFDARFFRIQPIDARMMDPQQRLLLETSWQAVEDAAIDPESLKGSRTGVYAGLGGSEYRRVVAASGRDESYYGSAAGVAVGRVAFALGLEGPAVPVDLACSSSLVAVHQAVTALERGEIDLALAGGANAVLATSTTRFLEEWSMLSKQGRCAPFDADADGYVRGEGCGMVMLKRLGDAEADGDRIWGVIRGSAVNQTGAGLGLTVPSGPAQVRAMEEALSRAGVEPSGIDYLEAHGPGTALGDAVEINAAAAVYGADRSAERPLVVGSVKANIGHLEAASAIAGLIKAVLAMKRGAIPGQPHFRTPTPEVDWERLPLRVPTDLESWPRAPDRPPLAAVNTFAISGANAHVVVEGYGESGGGPAPAAAPVAGAREDRPAPAAPPDARTVRLLALSGRSPQALRELAGRYLSWLDERREGPDGEGKASDALLSDMAFTAGVGRAHFGHRAGLTFRDAGSLREGLEALAASEGGVPHRTSPAIAFVYGSDGAWSGMGEALYGSEPAVRATLDRCDTVFRDARGDSLLDVMFGRDAAAGDLADASWAGPATYALQCALTELWAGIGIGPDVVAGHGLGKIAAGQAAGMLTLEEGLRLVTALARGESMPGGMAFAAPSVRLISAETGRVTAPGQALAPPHWPPLAGDPPAVGDWVEALADASVEVVVEIGPVAALAPAVAGAWPAPPDGAAAPAVFPTLREPAAGPPMPGGGDGFVEAVARAYEAGLAIDFRGLFAGEGRRRISLPGYPFQRRRYWVRPRSPGTPSNA